MEEDGEREHERAKQTPTKIISQSVNVPRRAHRQKDGVFINWHCELLAAAPINHPDSNMKSWLNFILLCSIVIKLPRGLLASQRPAATHT